LAAGVAGALLPLCEPFVELFVEVPVADLVAAAGLFFVCRFTCGFAPLDAPLELVAAADFAGALAGFDGAVPLD